MLRVYPDYTKGGGVAFPNVMVDTDETGEAVVIGGKTYTHHQKGSDHFVCDGNAVCGIKTNGGWHLTHMFACPNSPIKQFLESL
jgi:hypothetical protein